MKNIKKFFIIPLLSLATLTSMSYTTSTTTYVKAEKAIPAEKNKEILEKVINAARKTKSFEIITSKEGTLDGEEKKIVNRFDYKNYKIQKGKSRYIVDGKSYYLTTDNTWVTDSIKNSKESSFENGILEESVLSGLLSPEAKEAVSYSDIIITEKDTSYILTVKEDLIKEKMSTDTNPNEKVEKMEIKISVNKSTYVPEYLEMTMKGYADDRNIDAKYTSTFKEFDSSKPIELPKEAENAKDVDILEYMANKKLKFD